jgi:HSP20 family molecular chaperone IbpA
MRPLSPDRGTVGGLKIKPMSAGEQRKKIHDAIAHRALQISQNGPSEPQTDLLEWRRAQSEVLAPLLCGYLQLDDKIELTADTSCFSDKELEIWVEPKRLTLCGKRRVSPRIGGEKNTLKPNDTVIFRTLSLPIGIAPSQVEARFKGQWLEISLPMPRAAIPAHEERNAA